MMNFAARARKQNAREEIEEGEQEKEGGEGEALGIPTR